jgi:ankyrin repeat protein
MLMEKGANPNLKSKNGRTALTYSAAAGNTEIVKLLLEKGADITLKDNEGLNATAWAEKNNHAELAKFLKEAETKR